MADYSVFATATFDTNDYANAILAGEAYPAQTSQHQAEPLAKEDVSAAISKLDFAIEDVTKQIKTVVTAHHEDLLTQAANANDLSGSLTSVRTGLADLDTSLDKLRLKIRVPYQSLQTHVSRLQKLQQTSDVLRRTSRFVVLARRLQAQMSEIESNGASHSTENASTPPTVDNGTPPVINVEDEKERTISKAALSIAELVALLEDPAPVEGTTTPDSSQNGSNIALRSINAVASHVRFVEDARTKVTSEMEAMVTAGLISLNQSLLASSLQTAYNLRILPELTQSLVSDLSQAVEDRIRNAFDVSKISKDSNGKELTSNNSPLSPPTYKSRIRTEPTSVTAPQWASALWARLENMVEEMVGCCVKVYTLEKVLKMKKDTITRVVFLDEAMQVLENKPSATFWTSLGRSLERHTRDSTKSGSSFLQQTLSTGYPRLLRLFHEFFAKIAVHTDTVYTQTYQSPETVLILRALSGFETSYLSRSSNKLNEAVAQAFSGGIRSPPGSNEGINIARTVANELDSSKFDPLLVRSVAKNAVTSLELMLTRLDGIVALDRSAVTLIGPLATSQQISNGQLATFLFQCWYRLKQLDAEHSETVAAILHPLLANMGKAFDRITEPLLTAIRRELGATIAKLHRINFAQTADPMSGMGGSSMYMTELVEKLSFIKAEILSRFSVAEVGRDWVLSIVRFVIRTFVLHVSIAKPLGESGKLQLTSDMTELEFGLNAFMADNNQGNRGGSLDLIGEEYKTLRAIRPLLFLDNQQLGSSKSTVGLPPLIVLHHILVRSPVPLPHSLHGWQEAEYVRWVDEHSEEEAWTLVEGGLSHWEQMLEAEGGKPSEDAMEYVYLARTVLRNAQSA